MKTLKALANIYTLLAVLTAHASEGPEALVVKRDEQFKPQIQKVVLKDLYNSSVLEGTHFKIVQGTKDQAISLNENPDLVLKAATVYYHLTVARDWYAIHMNSSYVQNLPQITIRVEMVNNYDDRFHFSAEHYNPQHNNAVSIDEGKSYPKFGIAGWGKEIWFRPKKEVPRKDLSPSEKVMIDNMVAPARESNRLGGASDLIGQSLGGDMSVESVLTTVGSRLLADVVLGNASSIAHKLSRSSYWLDTALVPEIIYHEFSHIALSDMLDISYSSPLNEGYADYFAAAIAGNAKLAKGIKAYNVMNGKDGNNKKSYRVELEKKQQSNNDFVFGILWKVQNAFDADTGSQLIYESRKQVTSNSNLRDGLVNGLLQTCSQVCKSPAADQLKLYKVFSDKGI